MSRIDVGQVASVRDEPAFAERIEGGGWAVFVLTFAEWLGLWSTEDEAREHARRINEALEWSGEPDALSKPWRDYPLSVRAANTIGDPARWPRIYALESVETIADVLRVAMSRNAPNGWLNVRGCGRRTNREIVSMLEELGVLTTSLLDARPAR